MHCISPGVDEKIQFGHTHTMPKLVKKKCKPFFLYFHRGYTEKI